MRGKTRVHEAAPGDRAYRGEDDTDVADKLLGEGLRAYAQDLYQTIACTSEARREGRVDGNSRSTPRCRCA